MSIELNSKREEIIALQAKGMGYVTIGRKVGASRDSVRNALKRWGVKIDASKRMAAQKHNFHLRKKANSRLVGTVAFRDLPLFAWAMTDAKRYNWRYKNDEAFRCKERLRRRLRKVLKGHKSVSMTKAIGVSVAELRAHLAKQFVEGMGWHNFHLWHIDHIVPCAAFDLRHEAEVSVCFHAQNLRPLWAMENQQKNDSMTDCVAVLSRAPVIHADTLQLLLAKCVN